MTEQDPTPETPAARLRFRRADRMRTRGDFSRLFAGASRSRGPDFSIALCSNGLAGSRLGLSVGKRCWKRAVDRNRVRRVFREAFRLSLPELPGGYDVLMIASRPRLRPKLEDVRRDLVRLVAEAVERAERRRLREESLAEGS